MDLIYTDAEHVEKGVIIEPNLDMEIGIGYRNDFIIISDIKHDFLRFGSYVYYENTEYGGVIEGKTVDTLTNELIYNGRTWQGLISSKIIEPNAGQDYLIVNGDAHTIIRNLFTLLDLNDVFYVPYYPSDITITNYQFNRYINAYEGIIDMLQEYNSKLILKFSDGRVNATVKRVKDFSSNEEWDSSQLNFNATKKSKVTPNHLICAGQGELKDRLILHLYANNKKKISTDKYYSGIDEVVEFYDNTSCESLSSLRVEGVKHFKELLKEDEIEATFNELNIEKDIYDIGDIVGAYENITKTTVVSPIKRKVLKVTRGIVTIDCEVS